jgi:hypothetical protein
VRIFFSIPAPRDTVNPAFVSGPVEAPTFLLPIINSLFFGPHFWTGGAGAG